MKNIIFISPPAAGKGTQAQMISEKYNIPHISIGNILRKEMEQNTEIGNEIKEDMFTGNLIKDSIIIEVLNKRLNDVDCERGYILDGFPRTLSQAKLYDQMLEKTNKKIDCIFCLEIDKETAYKRTVGRLTCKNCQTVYNDLYEETKPLINDICDKCGGSLIRRDDDNVDAFEVRFQNYILSTKPLLDYYGHKDNFYKINSSINKEYTFKQITKIIDGGNSDD